MSEEDTVLELRRGTIEDLDALLPLVAAYRAFYRQTSDPQREREGIERNLRQERSIIFVALQGVKIIGFTQLFLTWSTVWLAPSLILEDLYVEPQVRGSGVATGLIARAMEHAREIGVVGMFLETANDNVIARRVYERAGWTREERFLKYNAPL